VSPLPRYFAALGVRFPAGTVNWILAAAKPWGGGPPKGRWRGRCHERRPAPPPSCFDGPSRRFAAGRIGMVRTPPRKPAPDAPDLQKGPAPPPGIDRRRRRAGLDPGAARRSPVGGGGGDRTGCHPILWDGKIFMSRRHRLAASRSPRKAAASPREACRESDETNRNSDEPSPQSVIYRLASLRRRGTMDGGSTEGAPQ